jgi:D-alanyl-D-alanine carboxypeptidase
VVTVSISNIEVIPMKLRLLILVPVFALCSGCSIRERPSGNPGSIPVMSQDLFCFLDQAVTEGPPAISVSIRSSDGVIWSGAAGIADLRNQKPASSENLFGIGSITKTSVAVVVLQLVEEGHLALSDTPGSILGQQVADIPNANVAQVSHLLNHTSGIPSFEDDPEWIRHGRGDQLDVEHVWGKAESLAYIVDDKPLFVPGENYSYSNTNYTLLGLMIEAVTGNDFVTEFERRIREPLGLSSIYLEGFEPVPDNRLTRRYHYNTQAFRRDAGINSAFDIASSKLIDASTSNLSSEWTAGGMVATADDLARFAIALRDGRLLSTRGQQYLTDWRTVVDGDHSFWAGHGLFRETGAGGIMIGHSGSVLGYTGYMGWYEDSDIVVTVLTNAGSMHTGEPVMTASRIVRSSWFSRLVTSRAEQADLDDVEGGNGSCGISGKTGI